MFAESASGSQQCCGPLQNSSGCHCTHLLQLFVLNMLSARCCRWKSRCCIILPCDVFIVAAMRLLMTDNSRAKHRRGTEVSLLSLLTLMLVVNSAGVNNRRFAVSVCASDRSTEAWDVSRTAGCSSRRSQRQQRSTRQQYSSGHI